MVVHTLLILAVLSHVDLSCTNTLQLCFILATRQLERSTQLLRSHWSTLNLVLVGYVRSGILLSRYNIIITSTCYCYANLQEWNLVETVNEVCIHVAAALKCLYYKL